MTGPADDDARLERRRRARRRVPERRPREAERTSVVRTGPRREGTGWRHPQRWLASASTVLLVGLGLVGLGPSALGTALSLLGAVTMLYAIHRFGRLGPEPGRSGLARNPLGARFPAWYESPRPGRRLTEHAAAGPRLRRR